MLFSRNDVSYVIGNHEVDFIDIIESRITQISKAIFHMKKEGIGRRKTLSRWSDQLYNFLIEDR